MDGYNKFVKMIESNFDSDWKNVLVDLSLQIQDDKNNKEIEDVNRLRYMINELYKKYQYDKTINVKFEDIFNDFKTCSLKSLSVIIMYYTKNENPNRTNNILEEMYDEYKSDIPISLHKFQERYDFKKLHKQGVLITSFILTTSKKEPQFHVELWSRYMARIIKAINIKHKYLVYLLWENKLSCVASFIKEDMDTTKKKTDSDKRKIISYLVLNCETLPQGRFNRFKGSNHFIITNHFLKNWYKPQIKWCDLD